MHSFTGLHPRFVSCRALTCLAEAAVPQLQPRGETLPVTPLAQEGCHQSSSGMGDTLGPGIADRTAASQASGSYAPGLSEGNCSRSRQKHTFLVLFFMLKLRIFFPLAAF